MCDKCPSNIVIINCKNNSAEESVGSVVCGRPFTLTRKCLFPPRQENIELKKSVTEQQDVIMGLRKDLAGASARLSDITGEMSESQKREMETNRELLIRRDAEVTELRQQMAKLSKIVDKQKEEVKILEEELR